MPLTVEEAHSLNMMFICRLAELKRVYKIGHYRGDDGEYAVFDSDGPLEKEENPPEYPGEFFDTFRLPVLNALNQVEYTLMYTSHRQYNYERWCELIISWTTGLSRRLSQYDWSRSQRIAQQDFVIMSQGWED
jgi:hypothetical protein